MRDVIEKRYIGHLPYILGAVVLLVTSSSLAAALYMVRASRPTDAPVATTATVVVFETTACDLCDDFRRQIGKPYQSSPLSHQAPLKYYDVTDGQPSAKKYKLAGEIWQSPTTVVFDVYGREATRMAGVPKTLKDFQGFVNPHVRRAQRDMQHVAAR